jgi:tetratricopeptide (TPR) repeat protein
MAGTLAAEIAKLRAQAEALAGERRFDDAIACFLRILALQPNNAGALLQVSYLHSLAGRYRQAHRYTMMAHAARPTAAEDVVELVSRLRTFNEPQAMLDTIRRMGPLRSISIPVLLQLAQRLSFVNLQDEAMRFLDEARRADPAFPPTLAARGQVLTYLGRLDEARQELQRCVTTAPAFAQPHWLLSRVRKWNAEDNHVAALRRELARPARTPDDLVLLQYALHKELDDVGDTDGAWQALDQACRLKRGTLRYDPAESVGLVDDLVAQRLPAAPAAEAGAALVPVFIVGMHRSGTTLLEQLLAGHPDVQDMGELYDFTVAMRWATDHHCRGVVDREIVRRAPAIDHAEVGARYLAGIAWRTHGRRFAVDKLPSNFLNLGSLLTALPQARVLHMVRDPMETCFSNLRELFSDANPYSYDQVELADYFAQYRRLMAHWHARFPGRIHDVHYDRLVDDPEAILRGVADYCGFGFEPAMLAPSQRPVATASAVQVRGGVRKAAQPKWQPYAGFLRPLAARLRRQGIADAPGL